MIVINISFDEFSAKSSAGELLRHIGLQADDLIMLLTETLFYFVFLCLKLFDTIIKINELIF